MSLAAEVLSAGDIGLPALTRTDYVNTIPVEAEAELLGDEALEARIEAINRWNAATNPPNFLEF